MSTLSRILRVTGRVLKRVGGFLGRASRRFAGWWKETYRSLGRRGKLVFVAISLLVACFLCGIPVSVFGPDPTPTPIAAVTPEPTSTTPAPTDTPEPTSTPLPPTETPEPTSTPTSTSTPEPTSTPTVTPTPDVQATAEADYRSWASGIASEYIEGLTSFQEQNQAMSEDLSLLGDEEWTLNTAAAIVVIRTASEQVINYEEEVPERYRPTHNELVAASELFLQSMDAYVEGVDNLDVDRIEDAIALMNEATEHVVQASNRLQEVED